MWIKFLIWLLPKLGFMDRAQVLWERERDKRKQQAEAVAESPKTDEELDKWLNDGKY